MSLPTHLTNALTDYHAHTQQTQASTCSLFILSDLHVTTICMAAAPKEVGKGELCLHRSGSSSARHALAFNAFEHTRREKAKGTCRLTRCLPAARPPTHTHTHPQHKKSRRRLSRRRRRAGAQGAARQGLARRPLQQGRRLFAQAAEGRERGALFFLCVCCARRLFLLLLRRQAARFFGAAHNGKANVHSRL